MKKFSVGGTMTISVYTVVKAESEAEARKIAESRGNAGFCHQCAGGDAQNAWTCDELDGDAEITSVQEQEEDD